jgi:hypothetical protein
MDPNLQVIWNFWTHSLLEMRTRASNSILDDLLQKSCEKLHFLFLPHPKYGKPRFRARRKDSVFRRRNNGIFLLALDYYEPARQDSVFNFIRRQREQGTWDKGGTISMFTLQMQIVLLEFHNCWV